MPSSVDQTLDLFAPGRRPGGGDLKHGYLDLLGERQSNGASLGQRLMESRVLPKVYERFWRPFGVRLLMGLGGPGTEEEHRAALEMLSISSGDRVLDVACGPGNFTRDFARAADEGLVVGLDASETMLAVAAEETDDGNVTYIRGDAADLPFADGSFDAVCCFAALYLIEEPMRALDQIVRVLAPGGRVALMSSCSRGGLPVEATNSVVRGLSGVRLFGRGELTGALANQGLVDVNQRVSGFAQFVSARKAPAAPAQYRVVP